MAVPPAAKSTVVTTLVRASSATKPPVISSALPKSMRASASGNDQEKHAKAIDRAQLPLERAALSNHSRAHVHGDRARPGPEQRQRDRQEAEVVEERR